MFYRVIDIGVPFQLEATAHGMGTGYGHVLLHISNLRTSIAMTINFERITVFGWQ
jgi:hypothetical protein